MLEVSASVINHAKKEEIKKLIFQEMNKNTEQIELDEEEDKIQLIKTDQRPLNRIR